ncbi:DEAD/DEAH box helicase [Nannocystis pusilla]
MTDGSAPLGFDPVNVAGPLPASSDMPFGTAFSAPVARWFGERFRGPTEAQRRGWAAISRGEDTLVMAPTGSGKTLAAFLAGVDALVRRGLAGALPDGVAILYISPLKALGADVERNLQQPLRGIEAAAAALGTPLPKIRTALRTGDSTASERARILKQPPHLLITTPESLYLLLTSDRGRAILGGCEQVIVDEIHALVGNKRGAHLALSLERLDALCGRKLQRIGLSATVEPPAEAARFLVGHDLAGSSGHAASDMLVETCPEGHVPEFIPRARPCHLVDAGRRQPLERRGRGAAGDAVGGGLADRLGRPLYPHRGLPRRAPHHPDLRPEPAAGRADRPRPRAAARRGRGRGPPRRAGQADPADGRAQAADRRAQGGGRHRLARASASTSATSSSWSRSARRARSASCASASAGPATPSAAPPRGGSSPPPATT